jgi:hypothetical protein
VPSSSPPTTSPPCPFASPSSCNRTQQWLSRRGCNQSPSIRCNRVEGHGMRRTAGRSPIDHEVSVQKSTKTSRQTGPQTLTNSGCTSAAEPSLSAGKPNRLRALLLAQPPAEGTPRQNERTLGCRFTWRALSRGKFLVLLLLMLSCVFPRSLHVSPLWKFGCGVSKCDLRQGKEPTGIDVSGRNSYTCWITSADGHATSPSSHHLDGLLQP